MEVLWEQGNASAETVRAALADKPHDSTVRTILRVLESKGYVRHRRQGRAYIYRAVIQRTGAERRAVRSMLKRFFGGSAEALVMRLIADEQLSPEKLEGLRRRVSRDANEGDA